MVDADVTFDGGIYKM